MNGVDLAPNVAPGFLNPVQEGLNAFPGKR
jgi:hypothetical protein